MTEDLKPLYDKKLKCPICTYTYVSKKVRSRFIRIKKIDSDFFTHYNDQRLNPILYEINVCSKCGYAYADTFTNSFSSKALERIKNQVNNHWNEREFSGERTVEEAIEIYKLALLSGSLKDEKSIVLAGLCLRISWLYRLQKNIEQEERFMILSIGKYKQSYMETDFNGTQMTEMRLLYLIGELSRRIGYRNEAVTHFSKVINHKNRTLETKLVEMAREQWYLIREQDYDESE